MNYAYERMDGNATCGSGMHTHLTAKDDGTARLDSTTGIDLAIFGTSFELYSATAYQTELDDGSHLDTASITIAGESAAGINIGYEKTLFETSRTFNIGPVPVFVSAGASGELALGLSFSGGVLTATPSAGIYATLEAGVGGECDVGSASAGIRGNLTFLEIGLPISLKVFFDAGQPWYTIQGDLTLGSLSGALELYAEAFVKLCFVKVSADWSYSLVKWTSIEWTKNLFSNTGTF